MKQRIVVGITGASGVIYGIRALQHLREMDVETHLILSEAARRNIGIETDFTIDQVVALADVVHDGGNIAAPVASGSFPVEGMMVVPCSIKTLSGIAHSYNDNLIVRAADVMLKEKRKLVLVVRETPLHRGHLKLMLAADELGAQIMPPFPAFYHRPETIEDILDQTVGKLFDAFNLSHNLFRRWQGA